MKKVLPVILSLIFLLIFSCRNPQTDSPAPIIASDRPFTFGHHEEKCLLWESSAPYYKLEFELSNDVTGEIIIQENRQPSLYNLLLNSFDLNNLNNVIWSDGNSHTITTGDSFVCTGWALSSQQELLSQKNIKWELSVLGDNGPMVGSVAYQWQ